MESSSKHMRNSILLTRILILLIALIAIYIIINSVSIATEFIDSRNITSLSTQNQIILACGIGYIGFVVLLRLLYIINQLLVNISKENVFITENVNLLRHASICCLLGSVLAFILAAVWSKLLQYCICGHLLCLDYSYYSKYFPTGNSYERRIRPNNMR